jgi:hypothetical protein
LRSSAFDHLGHLPKKGGEKKQAKENEQEAKVQPPSEMPETEAKEQQPAP